MISLKRRRRGRLAEAGMLAGALGAGISGLLGATAGGVWYQLFKRPLPKTRGETSVSGLEGRVEIRRDRWGAPSVAASSERDLWFGQGYCTGQDRLWQCEIQRRIANGRLAEIAGRPALRVDRFMRTLGLRRIALQEEAALEGEHREAIAAYCAGINAAAASASAPPAEFQLLRIEFEPWRPADMLAAGKLLSFGLSGNWERELLRADLIRALGPELAAHLEPRYPRGNPVVLDPGQGWSGEGIPIAEQIARVREEMGLAAGISGSNNWAVTGERSGTGGPLIAGDPHLPPSMPGIWYQIGLELGERFCRGASLPGVPGILMGQNNDVAWTFTNVEADVEDLFAERLDGDRYEFRGEWLPLETVEERIEVRGSESVAHRVHLTHHGPIVNEPLGADREPPLALRWTAFDFPYLSGAEVGVLEPTSGEELVQLLVEQAMPVSNLIWADRHGRIGYKTMGRIPIRDGDCPDLPKPGWTGEFEWTGTVPYDELPEITDPETGYLVTANNQIVDDDYPHHITSEYLDGYRAKRIEQLLLSSEQHDLHDFERFQGDLLSIPAAEIVHRLARLRERSPLLGQREIRAIERLKSWDLRLDAESVAASICQAFVLRLAREFTRAVIRDRDLSERYLDRVVNGFIEHSTQPWRWQARLLELWDERDDELIGRPWDELVADALRESLGDLEQRFGSDQSDWRWGDVHRLDFPHALGEANPLFGWIFNRSLRAGGGQETVSQIAYDPTRPYKAVWAPSYRMVADPRHPERSRWQAFTGQSGHPGSSHYDDLQVDWVEGRTQPMAGEGPWDVLTLVPA
jgi:penicillin amidase